MKEKGILLQSIMSPRDIIDWSSIPFSFTTYDSLLWIWLISSRKIRHKFITGVITHVRSKTLPKLVVNGSIFEIFPYTWFLLYCFNVVLEMCKGCNWPSLLESVSVTSTVCPKFLGRSFILYWVKTKFQLFLWLQLHKTYHHHFGSSILQHMFYS